MTDTELRALVRSYDRRLRWPLALLITFVVVLLTFNR
jgi:hypothetical protein